MMALTMLTQTQLLKVAKILIACAPVAMSIHDYRERKSAKRRYQTEGGRR